MPPSAYDQFIRAGFALYPQYGYQKLSVRLLAAEAGLSPGMFHHLFASKEAFVGEILQQKYGEGFRLLEDAIVPDIPVRENLRDLLFLLSAFVREHLAWIHRVLADSADGVACINGFIREHGTRHVPLLVRLLVQAITTGELASGSVAQYFCFITAGVMGPMIIGSRFQNAGLLPQTIGAHFADEVMSDDAIRQRIDWTLDALFAPQQAA